ISELSSTRVEKVEDLFQPGQKVQVKILRLDPTERKIGLSIRAVTEGGDISPERYSSGMGAGGGGSINLGDFAQGLRGDKKKRRKDKQDDSYEEDYED